MTRTWDIFCSVVDNYGDIGVCWRLARQLADDGQKVCLWLDGLASLHQLCPAVDAACESQQVSGVEVRRWDRSGQKVFPAVEPSEIVVEGFGVRLPESYATAMAARHPKPVWVNLEYLSAEPWVETHHALPSPHPTLPLTKYFFFPGFTPATGGLLIERGLVKARNAFQSDAGAVTAFRQSLGVNDLAEQTPLWVSLFCYDNAALRSLVDAWSASPVPIACIVPEGRALAQLSAVFEWPLAPGKHAARGALNILPVPFLDQDGYDRLLWSCDMNFVRGEDSFVRAQLAARPVVWQAYPQAENAHLAKMAAFLARYTQTWEPDSTQAAAAMFGAWNRQATDAGACWAAFCAQRRPLAGHAMNWAASLLAGRNLAETLANFCENQLK